MEKVAFGYNEIIGVSWPDTISSNKELNCRTDQLPVDELMKRQRWQMIAHILGRIFISDVDSVKVSVIY